MQIELATDPVSFGTQFNITTRKLIEHGSWALWLKE
jgi:hypothetical protein